MAEAEFEADWFATGQFAQLLDELHHLDRRGKRTVARRRNAVFAHQDAAGFSNLFGDLVLGQDPAVAGFGALAHLDFNHAHLRILCLYGEALRVETAVAGAAAEVAAAQLPGQITTVFAVIRADAAFACVVGEVAEFRPLIQRPDRVRAERAEAHRRNIEDRRRVRLRALRTPDSDAETVRVTQRRGAHRVADEFEAGLVNVDQRAERFVGSFVFRSRVHQRTLRAGEGQGIAVGLEQILANLRADAFDQITDVAQNRIIAAHCMARLQQVEHAEQAQHSGGGGDRPQPVMFEKGQAGEGEHHTDGKEGVAAQQRQAHTVSLVRIVCGWQAYCANDGTVNRQTSLSSPTSEPSRLRCQLTWLLTARSSHAAILVGKLVALTNAFASKLAQGIAVKGGS